MFQERGLLWEIVRIVGTGYKTAKEKTVIFGKCRCEKIAQIAEVALEVTYENGNPILPLLQEKHVVYWGEESDLAVLNTNKDFGCVNFQHKK